MGDAAEHLTESMAPSRSQTGVAKILRSDRQAEAYGDAASACNVFVANPQALGRAAHFDNWKLHAMPAEIVVRSPIVLSNKACT